MAEAFVTLSCASCGAKLAVYDDMDRFACRYCGTEMMVHRRGDTVALKTVAEAIQRLQAGTDKAAAELAIVRIEKELQIARARERHLLSAHDRGVGRAICFGGIVVLAGVFWIAGEGSAAGVMILLAGIGAIMYGLRRNPPEEVPELQAAIREKEQRLAEARAVADG
jgi:predicted RNA-binding Zn-ribbon protein involved in translation (DUF1610 family)